MRYRSGNNHQHNAGLIALARALVVIGLLTAIGCASKPEMGRLDNGMAEQIFTPRFVLEEDSTLNCQWVEFHRDSIGGAGADLNKQTLTFDSALSYAFIDRRYVQCIPELQRWRLDKNSTATFVAHSCIQECFMYFLDSTGKREAAWLAAPAVQTYPLKVDSLYLILHSSSTDYGLITLWVDRLGRELSRDTLDIPNPDFAGVTGGGVTLVKAFDNEFRVYHLGRACSWVDSGVVARGFDRKLCFGTDYAVQGDEVMIVSGYNIDVDDAIIETHVVNGAKKRSTHQSKVRPFSGVHAVACRVVATGDQFPMLAALSEGEEEMEIVLLAQDDDGYWAKYKNALSPVDESIQEFCATKYGETVYVACTVASDSSLAANGCWYVGFKL